MFIIFTFLPIFNNAFTVYMNKLCFCEELYVEKDCTITGCRWDSDPQLCFDYKCTDYTNQLSCDSRIDCAWDQRTQKCSTFSQCQAYNAIVQEHCFYKGNSLQGCAPSETLKDGLYQCKDYISSGIDYKKCEEITIQSTCSGIQYDGRTCKWNLDSQKCKAFKLQSCSDASDYDQSLCDTNYCIYKDKKCKTKKCKDITDEFSCTYILNIDKTEAEICSYANGLCQEMDGPETLTSQNCMTRTLGTMSAFNVKDGECVYIQYFFLIYYIFEIIFMFTPDIYHRYQSLMINHQGNQKVFDVLMNYGNERIYIQNAYAYSLDQLQKTLDIQEDGIINDDFVDLLQTYRSLLIQEKNQAEYMRDSLKTEVIPQLKELWQRQNDFMKAIEINTKDLDKRLKSCMHELNRRTKRYQQLLQQSAENERSSQQVLLIQSVNDYNKIIDEYFEGCAIQNSTYQQVDKERREVFRDINMKLQVFHISILKNIEYTTKKLTTKIEEYDVNKNYYQYKEQVGLPTLNKYNIQNYLEQVQEQTKPSQKSYINDMKDIWGKVKSQLNNQLTNQNYDTILYQVMHSKYKVDEFLLKKITLDDSEFSSFLISFQQLKLPQEAYSFLIPFNQYVQPIHRLAIDLIQYLYSRSKTEQTLHLTKVILNKYDSLEINESLKEQLALYRDNVASSSFTSDSKFCVRHFTLKLREQNIDLTQENREEVIAEIKYQIQKLLQIIKKEVILEALKQINLKQEEVSLLEQYLQ